MSKQSNTVSSDITQEDKEAIGEKIEHLRSDGGDDEALRKREEEIDFTGKGLDVPGRETLPDTETNIEDEENQLHSQGGENNKNLEESTAVFEPRVTN